MLQNLRILNRGSEGAHARSACAAHSVALISFIHDVELKSRRSSKRPSRPYGVRPTMFSRISFLS